mgnify:CR=1 FL=1
MKSFFVSALLLAPALVLAQAAPAKSAKPKGKPAAIDLADDLDDLEDMVGDLEL